MIVNHLDLIKLWPPCHPHQGRHKGWQRDHRFSPVLLELRKYSIGVILSSVSSGEEEENKGILLGKGSQEEKRTKSGLLPNQGGVGVSEGSKKTKVFQKQNSILENNFQWACRIILGPPKHVVHLVWSAYIISTAIRAALKIAQRSRILGKRRPVSKNKFNCFWNGTNRKICFTH